MTRRAKSTTGEPPAKATVRCASDARTLAQARWRLDETVEGCLALVEKAALKGEFTTIYHLAPGEEVLLPPLLEQLRVLGFEAVVEVKYGRHLVGLGWAPALNADA